MTRENFCFLFAMYFRDSEMSYAQCSEYLQIHPLTLMRYCDGLAAIHPMARESIIEAMKKKCFK